jgi:DNA-binding NarL/FixJ family response regulator
VLSCLSAGFHGYLHKTQCESDLLQAITDLLSGRIYVPQWVAERQDANVETISASLELQSLNLTPRQRAVLPLLAQGMSAKEIARALNIAVGTTKIHTAALLHALGARNRTEGAFIAARIMGDEGRCDAPNRFRTRCLSRVDGEIHVGRGRFDHSLGNGAFRKAPNSN